MRKANSFAKEAAWPFEIQTSTVVVVFPTCVFKFPIRLHRLSDDEKLQFPWIANGFTIFATLRIQLFKIIIVAVHLALGSSSRRPSQNNDK